MPILNYTTKIAAEKTVGEMQSMLSQAKAQAVMSEYDPNGVLVKLNFRIQTPHGLLTFQLPANVERIYKVICTQKNRIPARLQTREQASRVAWRILKDWLAAQLALIEAGMVELEQVFLPYAQDETGTTFYELMKERNFGGLALPAPTP